MKIIRFLRLLFRKKDPEKVWRNRINISLLAFKARENINLN